MAAARDSGANAYRFPVEQSLEGRMRLRGETPTHTGHGLAVLTTSSMVDTVPTPKTVFSNEGQPCRLAAQPDIGGSSVSNHASSDEASKISSAEPISRGVRRTEIPAPALRVPVSYAHAASASLFGKPLPDQYTTSLTSSQGYKAESDLEKGPRDRMIKFNGRMRTLTKSSTPAEQLLGRTYRPEGVLPIQENIADKLKHEIHPDSHSALMGSHVILGTDEVGYVTAFKEEFVPKESATRDVSGSLAKLLSTSMVLGVEEGHWETALTTEFVPKGDGTRAPAKDRRELLATTMRLGGDVLDYSTTSCDQYMERESALREASSDRVALCRSTMKLGQHTTEYVTEKSASFHGNFASLSQPTAPSQPVWMMKPPK